MHYISSVLIIINDILISDYSRQRDFFIVALKPGVFRAIIQVLTAPGRRLTLPVPACGFGLDTGR
jgi:hypothetical protein